MEHRSSSKKRHRKRESPAKKRDPVSKPASPGAAALPEAWRQPSMAPYHPARRPRTTIPDPEPEPEPEDEVPRSYEPEPEPEDEIPPPRFGHDSMSPN